MRAVTDRLTLGDDAATLTTLKGFLQVEHDEDNDLILSLFQEAKEAADSYLNNPFELVIDELILRGDGTTLTPIPLKNIPMFAGTETLYLDGVPLETDSYTIDYTLGTIVLNEAPALRSRLTATYEAELAIPTVVRNWCMKRVARHYEFRVQSLKDISETGVGSARLGDDDFSEISMYRYFRGF
jgi:hypothetical protein